MRKSSIRGTVRQVALAGALAVGGAVAAVPVRAETLTDALISAYRHSNLLDQNRALLRAADESVAQAVARLRPVINFIATAGYADPRPISDNYTASLALTAELELYTSGANKLRIESAKEAVLATREALVQVEQNVLLAAVAAYMEVIRAAEFVALRQNNVRLITQELRAARDRFEVGEVTRTDVSIAQARLAAARAGLAAAQGDFDVAREAYKAAVGRYPGNLRRPNRPPMTAKTVDAAKAIAVRTHPLIRQRQREVAVAELNVLVAKAALKPSVTGSVSTGIDQDKNASNSVSVRLTQPLYHGGRLSSLLRQALATVDADRAELLQSVVTVKQDVGEAWSNLSVAIASTEANVRQVRASQVAFEGVREEAKLGARTTLDVLDAEQDLLDARAALIQSQIQQFVAVYTLLSSMGLLTVEHLKLGIVTYDPAAYYRAVKDAPTRYVSPQGEKLDRVLKGLLKD
ncbi:MAG: TolC family outer membrane protein [Rhodobacter sp.]|nr:TolC family outer membrane protein [Rhodobacter sp.]